MSAGSGALTRASPRHSRARTDNLHRGDETRHDAHHDRSAAASGAVPPGVRARLLRRGVRGGSAGASQPPHRGTGPALAGEPGASRRPRCRGQQRRRGGDPGPGARRLLPGRRGLRAARRRQLRHRHRLPAERPGAGHRGLRGRGADRPRRGPAGPGLARGPHRSEHARQRRAAHHAPLPATLHRRRRRRWHRPGPQGLHLPAPDPPRDGSRPRADQRRDARGDEPGARGGLLPEPLGAHLRLQGDARRSAVDRVLPRPAGRAAEQRAGHGAQPLLHQHLPLLAPGASLPDDRAQR